MKHRKVLMNTDNPKTGTTHIVHNCYENVTCLASSWKKPSGKGVY